jgi:hypothetical protein
MARMSGARSNGPRLSFPISRMIVRTRRMAWESCDFRARSLLVVNWSRRIAPERYIKWHRQTDCHKARELVWADARCLSRLRRRLTAATNQRQSERANNGRPQAILPERLSAAAALAALKKFRADAPSMMPGN